MKKISTILAIIGMIVLSSCSGPEGPPGYDGLDGQDGLVGEVFELKNVNFSYNATDGYTIYRALNPKIFASDVVLIYRMRGTIDANTPIWQLIPRTLFLPQGELDYDFDFSKEDFTIYAGGNYDLSTTPSYLNNQTFRIVIVPGSFSTSINKNNYADVITALNIKESQIQNINF
ncbi:hypothetical protein SAMN05443667_101698 [Flavobacterium gillisiae]|uniref:Uncharacterized protein n=1 Tax=Flavobacterium gillisiae TaxID=150146 RepID=A0A1H3XWE2_9FLAO|nr:hypothetical protein [Flavobacterium gillisiae]SEA03779.1 hypothetical protein SAMN05443667_101698 [Flavobacterium gillisiae]